MERSHSSIFSSKTVLRDLVIGAVLVLGLEWYLAITMRAFEPREERVSRTRKDTPATTAPTNYVHLGRSDPASFFRSIAGRVSGPAIVFVGDSQGLGPVRGTGDSYPRLIARVLMRSGQAGTVISLHLIGANAYEQGALLLSLMKSGIDARVVVWAHSVFSHRKNEIRSELTAVYSALGGEIARYRPEVILLDGLAPPAADRISFGQSWGRKAADAWDKIINRSAAIRFSRQPLYEKYLILRRSPLARLIPTTRLPGTTRQYNPPPSLLQASAKFVGQISAALESRGIQVIDLLEPVNRAQTPRPFSPQSEAIFYKAFKDAVQTSGAGFLDLLDALAPERFGENEEGTPDPYHIDSEGHAEIAARIAAALGLDRYERNPAARALRRGDAGVPRAVVYRADGSPRPDEVPQEH